MKALEESSKPPFPSWGKVPEGRMGAERLRRRAGVMVGLGQHGSRNFNYLDSYLCGQGAAAPIWPLAIFPRWGKVGAGSVVLHDYHRQSVCFHPLSPSQTTPF